MSGQAVCFVLSQGEAMTMKDAARDWFENEATVPEGLTVSICKKDDEGRNWRRHVMKRPVTGPIVGGTEGSAIVESDGYLILTRRHKLGMGDR